MGHISYQHLFFTDDGLDLTRLCRYEHSRVKSRLESAPIRKLACEILEGGEEAFKERARRLRVRLER